MSYSKAERRIFRYGPGDSLSSDPNAIDRRFLRYMLDNGHEIDSIYSNLDALDELERNFLKEDRDREEPLSEAELAVQSRDRSKARYAQSLVSLQAAEKLADASRHAFNLPPFDGSDESFTEEDCIALLNAYTAWKFDVKKNTGGSPDGSPPTGGLPADLVDAADAG